MIAFIGDHRTEYGVEPICKVVPIAPYYESKARPADPERLLKRAKRDAAGDDPARAERRTSASTARARVADLTQVLSWSGFVYVAFVIDLFA
jgi:hypothetical protein